MELRLDGKVALVTGGSKGIGKAIGAALAGAGARVVLTSRKQEGLDDAAAEIGGDVIGSPPTLASPTRPRRPRPSPSGTLAASTSS